MHNHITDAAEIFEPSEERTVSIIEGQNTTLRCIGVGYPPPLVQWRKLSESFSDRVSITNMSMSTNEGNVTRVTVDLILNRISREDTGVYECSVSNLLNYVTRSTTLTVQCKPKKLLSIVVLNSRGLHEKRGVNILCASKFYVLPKHALQLTFPTELYII